MAGGIEVLEGHRHRAHLTDPARVADEVLRSFARDQQPRTEAPLYLGGCGRREEPGECFCESCWTCNRCGVTGVGESLDR